MSTSARKSNKRTDTYWELKKAGKALQQAGDKLATAGEALKSLGKALEHMKGAGQAAEATKLDWEEKGQPRSLVKRDALPAGLRRKISGLAAKVEAVMAEVKAIPVTNDQVVMAKAEKANRKAKK